MLKKIQFIIILFFSTGYVNAGYIDGIVLKEMLNAPINENAHLQYVGYNAAVIDIDNATNICVDYSASMQPILDTVQQYL